MWITEKQKKYIKKWKRKTRNRRCKTTINWIDIFPRFKKVYTLVKKMFILIFITQNEKYYKWTI
jgi:hypothetical protein